MNLLEIISVGFNVTDQPDQISCNFQIIEGKKWEYNETVHQLFIDFEKVPRKLAKLIKMCLHETYSKGHR
jgi:hypothetical protein